MSIVASNDGTTAYNPNSQLNPDPISPTKLTQVGKLVKIDNVHLPLFSIGSGTGETFLTRGLPCKMTQARAITTLGSES